MTNFIGAFVLSTMIVFLSFLIGLGVKIGWTII